MHEPPLGEQSYILPVMTWREAPSHWPIWDRAANKEGAKMGEMGRPNLRLWGHLVQVDKHSRDVLGGGQFPDHPQKQSGTPGAYVWERKVG